MKLPGSYEGDDDLPEGAAARRWTTVVLYSDELGWLREAWPVTGPPDALRSAR